MKYFVLASMVALCLSATAPAQDCGNWHNGHLAGTYTGSGSGYIDPSKAVPGMGLPSGAVPMFYVGAISLDGAGGGTGWLAVNVGGTQFKFESAGIKYSMLQDCSVQMTFSWKIKELGVTMGPVSRTAVIVPKPSALELHALLAGGAPGTPPAPGFDLGVLYRISMR